ncbi:hypothetical protein EYZ11_002809 [Aspergillus tanneri]|uniref:Luciferase domain-containing protein n=1 Tax=Aspergillus tanneri TaxID=1220188 RepID=A0A4S3JPT1_9EURO|nr:uncharacterized protein ATNIH1004_003334 [Aspergillus tanneri]KAA8650646.1 hypothetical protein ATNIH1004_003334 [Aspergillus tanneri]THC97703.1 hypothetical protein EYZ11_002809 [Aspergillus tanneri]
MNSLHKTLSSLPSLPSPPNLHLPITTPKLLLSALSATLIVLAYRDYRTYISYGPGGAPHNVLGWFGVRVFLLPFKKEMFSTEVYTCRIQAGDGRSFLPDAKDLSTREGQRPLVGPHMVPQRQLDGFTPGGLREKFMEEFQSFATQSPHLVKLAPSKLELHADAYFLADGLEASIPAQKTDREIAHIHRLKDGSVHVVLAPADCKKIFDAGWGQRHSLSGAKVPRGFSGKTLELPSEYVLIYAPRNENEVAFVMEVIKASVKYMTGG